MKIVYINLMILFILGGCSNVQQSSYSNDSAMWQKSQSKKALQDLEKE